MNKKRSGAGLLLILVLCAMMSMTAFAAKKTGWISNGGKWFYYDAGGAKVKGWVTVNKKTFYLHKSTGERVTGIYRIGGKYYSFNSKGVLKKTLSNAGWKKNSKGRWYDNGDGTYPKSCWAYIQGKRYLFDKEGYVTVGWEKVKNTWYYFGKAGVMITKKWVKSGKSYYYLGTDGKMRTNAWIGKRYVDGNGAWLPGYRDDTRTSKNKTGWVGYGSRWQYFKKGKAVTGWQQIKDVKGKKNWYYFRTNTYMQTGFFFDGQEYYFLDTRLDKIGIMTTGWMKINGNYYYFFQSGKMARNIKLSAGAKEYHFNEKGICTNFNS